jgi:hypothetical protein
MSCLKDLSIVSHHFQKAAGNTRPSCERVEYFPVRDSCCLGYYIVGKASGIGAELCINAIAEVFGYTDGSIVGGNGSRRQSRL